jgi:hypothetical protein
VNVAPAEAVSKWSRDALCRLWDGRCVASRAVEDRGSHSVVHFTASRPGGGGGEGAGGRMGGIVDYCVLHSYLLRTDGSAAAIVAQCVEYAAAPHTPGIERASFLQGNCACCACATPICVRVCLLA